MPATVEIVTDRDTIRSVDLGKTRGDSRLYASPRGARNSTNPTHLR